MRRGNGHIFMQRRCLLLFDFSEVGNVWMFFKCESASVGISVNVCVCTQGFIQDFCLGEGTRWAINAPPPRPDPSKVMYAYINEIIDVFKQKNRRINL